MGPEPGSWRTPGWPEGARADRTERGKEGAAWGRVRHWDLDVGAEASLLTAHKRFPRGLCRGRVLRAPPNQATPKYFNCLGCGAPAPARRAPTCCEEAVAFGGDEHGPRGDGEDSALLP